MNCCVNDAYNMECYVLSDCVLSDYHIDVLEKFLEFYIEYNEKRK